MIWQVSVRLQLGELRLEVDLGGEYGPLALVGPNGSGKTTLLRTIAGAYRPQSGKIQVGGRTVFDSKRGLDIPPEDRHVGYVPQGYGLFPHLSVIDNVAFGWISRIPRRTRAERRQAAMKLLEQVGCAHLARRLSTTLSGGEQQKIALARALTTEPEILLLDEPLSALDAPAKKSIRSYLTTHLQERNRPSIVVSHDARDVVSLGAEVCVIEHGQIVQRGSTDALRANPKTEFVEAFFEA